MVPKQSLRCLLGDHKVSPINRFFWSEYRVAKKGQLKDCWEQHSPFDKLINDPSPTVEQPHLFLGKSDSEGFSSPSVGPSVGNDFGFRPTRRAV